MIEEEPSKPEEEDEDEDFYPDLAATLKKPVKVLPEEEPLYNPSIRGKVELIIDEEAVRLNSEISVPN